MSHSPPESQLDPTGSAPPRPIVLDGRAVLPTEHDNAAIATIELAAGAALKCDLPGRAPAVITLAHAVPEGHRFAVAAVPAGAALLSWGLPFGYAVDDIVAGDYLATERMLEVLRARRPDLHWPDAANFENRPLDPYRLDPGSFVAAAQLDPVVAPTTFAGYPRGTSGRSERAGTRNHVVILGTSAATGPFAETLAARFAGAPVPDPVVAVAHTEGSDDGAPANLDLLLRTLTGFARHPNVGALLVVDEPGSPVAAAAIAEYADAHDYPAPVGPVHVLHRDGGATADLDRGAEVVTGWLPAIGAQRRTEIPLSRLAVALQCGGSDAFSGVSANPLAAAVAAEVIRHGGIAELAETDELIGAETYVLERVRDLDTARAFLDTVATFSARVRAHGHTAEGNVSGGNIMRGLYNITLKSLGAARKRDPRVRLDHVIDYAEPLPGPGYAFMNSPGNDLESVAGQVASGCNLIFFTTGNGSITNFPFVPTVKFVSTTRRHGLLSAEMDVNAGEILDGVPLEALTARVFDLARRTASGAATAGERAGHSQVSIWRTWRQLAAQPTPHALAIARRSRPELDAVALPVPVAAARPELRWAAADGRSADRVGLVLPTSICSGQIALKICSRLGDLLGTAAVSRFVALPHTEGCGATTSGAEDLWARTATGYLTHPSVGAALLLEHGCEITHNDFFRARLGNGAADLDRFGWASIQADGGIDAVTERVSAWFAERLADLPPLTRTEAGLDLLHIGLHALGAVDDCSAAAYADLALAIAATGGTVVVPSPSSLWDSAVFRSRLGIHTPTPTIAHAQVAAAGLHVMETPGGSWLETATGLGASGVDLIAVHVSDQAVPGHRLVPVLQTADDDIPDIDLPRPTADGLMAAVLGTASRRYEPIMSVRGLVGFQVTRGLLGVSI